MADDQGPKIASIDELVNELTKKNPPLSGGHNPSIPPKPPMNSQFQPNPQPEIPKPKFTPPPAPSTMPRPFPSPVPTTPLAKPAAPPVRAPLIPPASGPVKEYQSSIRTMKEDISTLKQGQKPAGVDVPRIIQPPAPPAVSAVPKPPVQSPSGGSPEGRQFKMPSVNLGEAQKTGPLPPAGKSVPVPPMPTGRQEKSQIYAPPLSMGGTSSSRNRLFGIIAGAVVLFGVLYWFLVLRVPKPEIVEESPAPSPTATATSISLNQIFGPPNQITVPTTEVFLIYFTKKIEQSNWPARQFTALNITDESGNKYPISKFMGIFSATPDLLANLDQQEWIALAYGQTEKFDEKGILTYPQNPIGRFAILTKVVNPELLRSALDPWEMFFNEETKKIGQQLKDLGLPNPFELANEAFLDNAYKEVNIRYRNLFYPDKSVDYGIISMPESGTEYFFVANSRESTYSIIDFLQNR